MTCDCRKPRGDKDNYINETSVIRCLGCGSWLSCEEVTDNKWGFTWAEQVSLFGIDFMMQTKHETDKISYRHPYFNIP